MGNYKIHKVWTDRFGTVQNYFSGDDGKRFALPTVGYVWKFYSGYWHRSDTVVESKQYGLLRYTPFKSRTTKPLITLSENEVYLPVELTGRALRLDVLPESI